MAQVWGIVILLASVLVPIHGAESCRYCTWWAGKYGEKVMKASSGVLPFYPECRSVSEKEQWLPLYPCLPSETCLTEVWWQEHEILHVIRHCADKSLCRESSKAITYECANDNVDPNNII